MSRWPARVKRDARKLRKSGFTFPQIISVLGVSKSTLHYWLSDIPRQKKIVYTNRRDFARLIQPLGTNSLKRKRELELAAILNEVRQDVSNYKFGYSREYFRSLLALLYWAEGAKTTQNKRPEVRFANTDPRMCELFISLLRKSYDIDESKFRIYLYLHYYHDIERTKQFWSDLLDVPLSQFAKIRIKRRAKSRFRENHRGICFIRYHSVDLQHRISSTAIEIYRQLKPILRP